MKGRLALGAVAAVVLATAFYLGRSGQAPVKPAGEEAQVEEGGYAYVARGVTVSQADEQGRQQYALAADQVEQHAGDGRIAARGVTLHYEDSPGAAGAEARHWSVRADQAQLPQQGSVVGLAGNVVARGIPPGSESEMTVRTQRLDYDMRAGRLHTEESVRFEWNGSELAGMGLDADLATGLFNLGSGVRGRVAY